MANKKRKNRKKNIVRFPGGMYLNIGVVVYLFIALYIGYSVYRYFTTAYIGSYEVGQGTIEVNTSYTGLIIRQETVVTASQSGKLDYFLKDNTKARNGTLICSIDENGSISEKLNENADTSAVLSKDNLADIQNSISEYAKGFQNYTYYTTYNFKSDLSGKLMEARNLGALSTISDYTEYAQDVQTFHLYRAGQPGIVAYYTDGMEALTADQITAELFDRSAYQKQSMKTAGSIKSGQPVYKLITDENWQIVVPIDASMKETLAEGSVVEIKFREDNATAWADYTIEQKDDKDYLILHLNNSMIRYAYERFIDINILLDQQTGLKIPNSAITTKTFEQIPNEYFMQGNGTSNQIGLMVRHLKEDASYSKAEFIPTEIYYEDEENKVSYISQPDVKRGDLIMVPDSTQEYEVSDTAKLNGVYNINKGYAVFKQIEEIYHNENYTIVKFGTKYGISLYDHIALEGDSVIEEQIISK